MNLDDLVLSGALFSTSRSASPVRSPSQSRSPSPDPLFPSNDNHTDSDDSSYPSGSTSNPTGVPAETHMRPGRTGVKGVIRDHNEAVSLERVRRAQEIKETNRRMEKMALTARTFAEDEEERLHEKAKEEGWNASDREEKKMFERTGRFGHLREVGEASFVSAIEGESSGTWVVLHIYDPSLSRCHDLDAVLARLARQYPETKFLRARASAVGFASLSSTSSSGASFPQASSNLITIHEKASYDGDDDDPYSNPHSYDEEDEQEAQDVTDTDMLPSLLVYRSGQIVHTWIRADWEAEAWGKRREGGAANAGSIEALLRGLVPKGHNIIQPASNGNCGFSSDEDDLSLEFALGDGGDDDDDLFDL